jgi:hypothetical protein
MPYYKYLEARWAEALVAQGLVMFSSLSWFNETEDPSRGDALDGTRRFFPLAGLEVTQVSDPPGTVLDPDHSFQSAARYRDHIFIFCVSRVRSCQLKEKFAGPGQKEPACVEIHDVGLFCERLSRALEKCSPVQRRTFFHDDVTYYRFEDPPGNVWPLPSKLATHKVEQFSEEEEHRFVFSTKRNAFAFQRVDLVLAGSAARAPTPTPTLDPARHRRPMVLGSLGDCCRVLPCP